MTADSSAPLGSDTCMKVTIRLSARATPGTERTRCTSVSSNACGKSMVGVLRGVTQRSALACSIVIDALSRMPRNRPTCTSTSVTANATPATVIRKRSLSCSRFLRARSTAMSFLLGDAADERVDQRLRGFARRTRFDPLGFHLLGNVEREHAVHRRPRHLRQQVRILVFGAHTLFLD